MIRILKVVVWAFDILRCLVILFTPLWWEGVRYRSERQWEAKEQCARVRWAYACDTVRHNELYNQGYTSFIL